MNLQHMASQLRAASPNRTEPVPHVPHKDARVHADKVRNTFSHPRALPHQLLLYKAPIFRNAARDRAIFFPPYGPASRASQSKNALICHSRASQPHRPTYWIPSFFPPRVTCLRMMVCPAAHVNFAPRMKIVLRRRLTIYLLATKTLCPSEPGDLLLQAEIRRCVNRPQGRNEMLERDHLVRAVPPIHSRVAPRGSQVSRQSRALPARSKRRTTRSACCAKSRAHGIQAHQQERKPR